MRWFSRWRGIDDDVQEEIRSHLALAEQDGVDGVADGETKDRARLAALKEFGNVTLTAEATRRVWYPWGYEQLRDLLSDVRYAIRVLTKAPGFCLAVGAVLAIGIGLNAAVFTVFKALALKPLAGVEDSGHLLVVLSRTKGGADVPLSYPDFRYLRDENRAFADVSGSSFTSVNLGTGSRGERLMAEFVTGNYFRLLGVSAQLGRTLLPSDEITPGGHPVVVLSDGLWRRAFGADPDIVGKTIRMNAQPLTVVGVAAPDFHGTVVSFDIEAFIPVMMASRLGLQFQDRQVDVLDNRKAWLLMVLARPRVDVPWRAAEAQTAVLSTQLATSEPREDIAARFRLVSIMQSPYGAQTYILPAVTVLGGMGALLLLIVCANIAGLVLVRGVGRRGEMAVRMALGASRARIVRLLLVENLVLAVPAAAIGLLVLTAALPGIWGSAMAAAPGRMFMNVGVDRLVFAFTALASVATAVVFGFVPALRSARIDLMTVMKDDLSPRGSTKSWFRSILVAAQVAISVLLLVGAGLVTRSLEAVWRTDVGFDEDRVISVTLDVAPTGYDEARGRRLYQTLLDRVRADGDIEAASLASIYPLTLVDFPSQNVTVEGYAPKKDEDLTFLSNTVAPEYFHALHIALVAGREFEVRDDLSAPPVTVINQTFAQTFWGSADSALGKRIRVASGEWRTIVGVAHDVKYARVNEGPRPYVYLPFLQAYQPNMILHTRARVGGITTAMQIDRVRNQLASLDPDLPVLSAQRLSEQTRGSLTIFLMTASMLVIFGIAAMGLAAMGIYGLVSYTVRQSTHEIGIRMALGAQPRDVVRRFLGHGLRLSLIGAMVGIVAAVAISRLLAGVLYGVSTLDPVSFVSAFAVVLGSAALATLIPAWRGCSRISPITALRHE